MSSHISVTATLAMQRRLPESPPSPSASRRDRPHRDRRMARSDGAMAFENFDTPMLTFFAPSLPYPIPRSRFLCNLPDRPLDVRKINPTHRHVVNAAVGEPSSLSDGLSTCLASRCLVCRVCTGRAPTCAYCLALHFFFIRRRAATAAPHPRHAETTEKRRRRRRRRAWMSSLQSLQTDMVRGQQMVAARRTGLRTIATQAHTHRESLACVRLPSVRTSRQARGF